MVQGRGAVAVAGVPVVQGRGAVARVPVVQGHGAVAAQGTDCFSL